MRVERIVVNGHELTAFDLPPEPTDTYSVHVDGLGDVVVEKGKPPKEKDVPAMYMRKLVPELCEQNAELYRENIKLRELVAAYDSALMRMCDQMQGFYSQSDTYPCDECELGKGYGFDKCGISELQEGARELGVEVN